MTFEKRCSVELSDILAVSFECGNCGAAFRVPTDKLDREGIGNAAIINCGYCSKPTGFDQRTLELNALAAFLKGLKLLSDTANEHTLKIKMELLCLDPEEKP